VVETVSKESQVPGRALSFEAGTIRRDWHTKEKQVVNKMIKSAVGVLKKKASSGKFN
jgi:hypothetical protein